MMSASELWVSKTRIVKNVTYFDRNITPSRLYSLNNPLHSDCFKKDKRGSQFFEMCRFHYPPERHRTTMGKKCKENAIILDCHEKLHEMKKLFKNK